MEDLRIIITRIEMLDGLHRLPPRPGPVSLYPAIGFFNAPRRFGAGIAWGVTKVTSHVFRLPSMLLFFVVVGLLWEIFEVSHPTLSTSRAGILPEAFRTGWLVFDSGAERRRLAPVPGEWSDLPSGALQSLLDRAVRVARRNPVPEA